METENLVVTAYNIIFDRITKFVLSPGAPVSDFALSREIGISRTPVREAILQLVDEGLVERSGRGFIVTPISSGDLIDLYDARCGIELTMLKLSMEKGISPDSLKKMRDLNAILKQYVESGDILRALRLDNEIHEYLSQCSGNKRLLSFYSRISKQVVRISVFTLAQKNEFAADEHELIFKAIEKGDTVAACKALEDNILKAKVQLLSVLEDTIKEGWIGIAQFIWKQRQ